MTLRGKDTTASRTPGLVQSRQSTKDRREQWLTGAQDGELEAGLDGNGPTDMIRDAIADSCTDFEVNPFTLSNANNVTIMNSSVRGKNECKQDGLYQGTPEYQDLFTPVQPYHARRGLPDQQVPLPLG